MTEKLKNEPLKKLQLKIGGMHCSNCEVLIERRFKTVAGVRKVKARHGSGKAEISYAGDLDLAALQSAVADDGYTVSPWHQRPSGAPSVKKNAGRDYFEIGAVFLVLVGLYLVLEQLDVLPDQLAMPDDVSYGLAFLIGVIASLSTCIAVTGGLLVAVAAKYNAASGGLTGAQRFKPHIYFNVGRIVSYTVLGGAVGALGSALTLSAEANGIVVILASIIMIALGLQMLGLLPSLGAFQPRMPKFIAHRIHRLTEKDAKGGAFILGASTFFLPCGFTQALQFYVLAKGSFTTGALVMLAFALGTLPALLSLSALSSFVTGAFQRYFLKFAGAAVVLLGLFNIQSGFTLSALGTGAETSDVIEASATAEPSAPVVHGKQIVNMKIVGYEYVPSQFTVTAGVPVEWRIDARQAIGCGRVLIAPRIGVQKLLSFGPNVISFTPEEAGNIRFNCGMGMMTRGSKFMVRASAPVVVASAAPVSAAKPSESLPLSAAQRGEVEQLFREYLLENPEIIQEAMAELQARQEEAAAEQYQAAVGENAAAIFASEHQVVLGNPEGNVTLVEFFDYNCGYCKRALGDMIALLQADPKLRLVLKEFPVLGEPSTQAATVAVAVRMQDESGKKYLEFHEKLLGGEGPADRERALAVATEVGLDMARIERDMASPEVQATLTETFDLAQAIGINGTPSYVIGSEVVVGAVGLEALREKIDAVRLSPPEAVAVTPEEGTRQ
jgi:sulfite exporter TauE/SafE/protein-disulfide isomerase/copper chaperone CopZ